MRDEAAAERLDATSWTRGWRSRIDERRGVDCHAAAVVIVREGCQESRCAASRQCAVGVPANLSFHQGVRRRTRVRIGIDSFVLIEIQHLGQVPSCAARLVRQTGVAIRVSDSVRGRPRRCISSHNEFEVPVPHVGPEGPVTSGHDQLPPAVTNQEVA